MGPWPRHPLPRSQPAHAWARSHSPMSSLGGQGAHDRAHAFTCSTLAGRQHASTPVCNTSHSHTGGACTHCRPAHPAHSLLRLTHAHTPLAHVHTESTPSQSCPAPHLHPRPHPRRPPAAHTHPNTYSHPTQARRVHPQTHVGGAPAAPPRTPGDTSPGPPVARGTCWLPLSGPPCYDQVPTRGSRAWRVIYSLS